MLTNQQKRDKIQQIRNFAITQGANEPTAIAELVLNLLRGLPARLPIGSQLAVRRIERVCDLIIKPH